MNNLKHLTTVLTHVYIYSTSWPVWCCSKWHYEINHTTSFCNPCWRPYAQEELNSRATIAYLGITMILPIQWYHSDESKWILPWGKSPRRSCGCLPAVIWTVKYYWRWFSLFYHSCCLNWCMSQDNWSLDVVQKIGNTARSYQMGATANSFELSFTQPDFLKDMLVFMEVGGGTDCPI